MSKMILSLDGGGIGGAASSRFLELIEHRLGKQGKSLRDCVDFYAGTNTGSIIALALATTSMPMHRISDLYDYDTASKIFAPSHGLRAINGINTAKYEARRKANTLKGIFGGATLNNVPEGKHVLAVSYDIERRRSDVIKSTNPRQRNLFSYQVADASNVSPTYLASWEMHVDEDGPNEWLVDGAVAANNPTMCAVTEAKRAWPDEPIGRMHVLSVGTGYRIGKVDEPTSQGSSTIQWFTEEYIFDMSNDERVVANHAMTLMKQGSYIRVNADIYKQPGLPNPPDAVMDDVSRSNIDRLRAMGEWWFEKYGDAVVGLLLGQYDGPSLDCIDADTGEPKGAPKRPRSSGRCKAA